MSKILIVDDHEENLYLLRAMLTAIGAEVLEAANGAEALALARRTRPDLIISDILMPQMDGYALCRECKRDERLRDVPFVFYTATYTDARDEALALQMGAARFIVKPVESEEFHAVVSEVLSEGPGDHSSAPPAPPEEETEFYRMYSDALVRKLEDKMLDLDRLSRDHAEHAHFLGELLESIPAPVFYKDAALRYVGCNEAFARFVGHPRDEVVGKSAIDVYPAELATRFEASDRALLAHPDTPLQSEMEVPGPDQRVRSVVTHKAVFSDIDGKPIGIVGVKLDVTAIRRAEEDLAASAAQLQRTLDAAIAALAATTELRDPYTAGHQRRVAELACAISVELDWPKERVESLRTAALLHDIGKIVVPAEILSRPGRLTDTEMLLVRQHATASADTVADIFQGVIAETIRQHHERLDGSGYPAGLGGEEILPEARVLAVADVCEAMLSHRPYRPALPLEEAVTEIEGGADTRYDADASAACVSLFGDRGFAFVG